MTRLAIVGASVRAAAQSALRAGLDVVGADLFADADLDGLCPITRVEDYPDGLADWLARQEVDAWMYTGALENYPDLVNQMAAIAPLWGVSGEALRRCRNPTHYEPALLEAGIASPTTVPASRITSLAELGGPCLAKTYRHAAGAGVWPLSDGAALERAREAGAFVQKLLQPSAALAAVYAVGPGGAALLGVTRQLFDEGQPFAYRGSIGPLPVGERQTAELERLGACLAESLGLRGLVGVDLVEFDGRLCVVEINPRFTASIEVLERVTGRSAIADHAAACRGESIPPWTVSSERTFTKRIVFASEAAVVSEEFAAWLAEISAADRPRFGQRIGAGEPVCTLFAEGSSEPEATTSLGEAARDALRQLVGR